MKGFAAMRCGTPDRDNGDLELIYESGMGPASKGSSTTPYRSYV